MGIDGIEEVRKNKSFIRRSSLKKRAGLSDEERRKKSVRICERFIKSREYENAGTILLYKAYNNEVDTDLIFERAIKDGKTVAYPLSDVSHGLPDLKFYVINDLNDFCPGYKGILEPDPKKAVEFTGKADVCITPGAAFDRKCHRIGYGKGFYDTYLSQKKPGSVIGLAFDIQIADEFETEENDRTADIVLTESEVFYNEQ